MTDGQAGRVVTVQVAHAVELHREVGRLVREAQHGDPMATVTLVVDSPMVGTLLRRQLVAGGVFGDGVAGLRLLTLAELVEELADLAGVPSAARVPHVVREAVVSWVLSTEPGAFERSREHPSTALALGSAMTELQWCPIDASTMERVAEAAPRSAAVDVLEFVTRARRAMHRTQGVRPAVDEVDDVVPGLAARADPGAWRGLGALVVVAQRVPAPVGRLIAAAAQHIAATRIQLDPPGTDPVPQRVLDCPDPGTEAALAVRQVVAALAAGSRTEQVAVLYTAGRPYAALLAAELDAAGVTWHGPTATTLGATALARVTDSLLAMAVGRSGTDSGVTRPLLLRWFATARVYDHDATLPTAAWRRLVRDANLFGDSAGWRTTLDTMADGAGTDSTDGGAFDVCDEAEAALDRRRARDAAAAAGLSDLLDRLAATLDAVVTAGSWRDLGTTLWQAIVGFHLATTWWTKDPAERQAHERIHDLLVVELPALDALADTLGTTTVRPEVVGLRQILTRDLAGRRGRHGDLGAGVHVGPLAGAATLHFDQVVVVGAAEGILPPAVLEDPLLPDAVRLIVRAGPDDLATSVDRVARSAIDYRAVVAASATACVTRPRGAVPGRGTAQRSRFLPPDATATAVLSRRASLGHEPWPVAPDDLAVRALLADPESVPEPLERAVEAARAARRAGFDRHHGDLTAVDGPVWGITDRPLSASAIESFLHCPYHFFVQRVLGVTTDTAVDEIDVITPRDLGTLLHSALENLVTTAQRAGWAPGAGEPWPPDAEAALRELFDELVADAKARGLTGWEPSWEATYDRLVATFGPMLALDTAQVRADPPTAPTAAELGFGGAGEPVVTLEVDGERVLLRGVIDRADLTADGRSVGIVDYKSGKSGTFSDGLGKPKPKGVVPERAKVQDLVYDTAARALFPRASDVVVRFLFVPDDGVPTVITADHVPDPPAVLRDLLTTMGTAGREGRFAPRPRGAADYCPVCRLLGRRAVSVAREVSGADADAEQEDA